jgi:hypothetical protein
MVSNLFKVNFEFGDSVKERQLEDIIYAEIKKIKSKLSQPKIKKGSLEDDMKHGVDFILNWDIPIAFRGRRVPYIKWAGKKKGGSFTLRRTGERGGKAEIYKMINGEYKAQLYVFIWSCGSYAVLNVNKWIKSGLLEKKLKGHILKNDIKVNTFVSFYLSELRRHNCIISFVNNTKGSILDFSRRFK